VPLFIVTLTLRYVTYANVSYGSLQMHEEAANMYAVRASMLDSWEEETFIAMYRRAEHLDWASHPWPEVQLSSLSFFFFAFLSHFFHQYPTSM
jgi:hypothetical protein